MPAPNTRVLVAAATKHGATAEIGDAVGRVLAEEGLAVTVEAVDAVTGVDGFDAVVLGSAVYVGHWLESARAFVESNAEALRARPTWLFSSGPVGDPPRPKADEAVKVDELVAASGAREHRLFGGRVETHRLGFTERAVLLAVGAKEGDYRDWDEISAWAREIAQVLQAEGGGATP
jgi:menaquinone-dependent protoporphyrinogen oxidase